MTKIGMNNRIINNLTAPGKTGSVTCYRELMFVYVTKRIGHMLICT